MPSEDERRRRSFWTGTATATMLLGAALLDVALYVSYGLLVFLILVAATLLSITVGVLLFGRPAPSTRSRRLEPLVAIIVQFLPIAPTVVLVIISVLSQNYAAAAAFGALGALFFAVLKAMGGWVVAGVDGAAGADIYRRVKQRLFKQKASTPPPDA